jgi:hypothetical protein
MHLHGLIHLSDKSMIYFNQIKDKKQRALKLLTKNFKIRIQ